MYINRSNWELVARGNQLIALAKRVKPMIQALRRFQACAIKKPPSRARTLA